MTVTSAISIMVDFLAVALLIYGFINEEKVIRFEMAIKRIVLGNIRRMVRIRNYKKAVANGQHLHEVKKVAKVQRQNTFVA